MGSSGRRLRHGQGIGLEFSNGVKGFGGRCFERGGDMQSAPGESTRNAEVEAAVRQYLGRVARRYTPFVVGAITLLVIVVLVPTVNKKQASNNGTPLAAGAQPGQATESASPA